MYFFMIFHHPVFEGVGLNRPILILSSIKFEPNRISLIIKSIIPIYKDQFEIVNSFFMETC